MKRIWREAFGEAFPEGVEHYAYLTTWDLEQISSKLALPAGAQLLDIGCGKGGPGLKIAEKLGLQLTGMDIVPEAVEAANAFKDQFDLTHPATFSEGELLSIPLPDQSMDAAICIDSIWSVHDKIQALREIKRVLKPGAPFVFTHWDLLSVEAVPLLEQSGMSFISREDTPNWKEYQQKVYEGIKKYQQDLVTEMGDAAAMLLYEAQTSPAYLDLSVRRIYHMQSPAV